MGVSIEQTSYDLAEYNRLVFAAKYVSDVGRTALDHLAAFAVETDQPYLSYVVEKNQVDASQ